MNLIEILRPECVVVPLEASSPAQAIEALIASLEANGQLTDGKTVLEAVLAREQTRSTGIGKGLAVPHGKSKGCGKLTMAIGKPAEPIDFNSQDGQACGFIVLLASPIDETGPHIQALASVSRLWLTESFRQAVAGAQTSEALYQAFQA